MAKPISKSEARWKFWREQNPWHKHDGFMGWVKLAMRRARRRASKEIVAEHIKDYAQEKGQD